MPPQSMELTMMKAQKIYGMIGPTLCPCRRESGNGSVCHLSVSHLKPCHYLNPNHNQLYTGRHPISLCPLVERGGGREGEVMEKQPKATQPSYLIAALEAVEREKLTESPDHFNFPAVIAHFYRMQKQAENSLGTPELGDWHRGFYVGERGAYKHCATFLEQRRRECAR